MTGFLGLDGGGSATRWALADAAGQVTARGELPPVSGHLYGEAARQGLTDAAVLLRAVLPAAPRAVVAGITGLGAGAPEAETARAILAAALGIDPARIFIHEDIWIAYHAVFPAGGGHVVYAGTGSIGLTVRTDGTALRVGGRGMIIDDGGSAAWIARQALELVWRRRDEDPGFASPLTRALAQAIGGDDWDAHRTYVYSGDRGDIAVLARAVATADDPDAAALFARAGQELARLAVALRHRAGPGPVALLGRGAGLHKGILAAMRAALPEVAITRHEHVDAAGAAARLARTEGERS